MKEFSFVIIPDIELGRPVLDLTDRFRGTKEAAIGKEIEKRLLDAIHFVNTIPGIDFVIMVGDLTDSALPEQFFSIKEFLDRLDIPWMPVIGNHDLHPYRKIPDSFLSRKHSWESEAPTGPIIFEEIFRENLQRLSEIDGWQKQKTSFQNYTFLHKGVRFIVIDNMSRRHAILGFPGVIGTPHLYLETKDWLQEQLGKEEEKKIIISHAPLKRKLLRDLSADGEVVNIAGHWHKESLRESDRITTFITGALYLQPVITVVKSLAEGIEFHSVRIP